MNPGFAKVIGDLRDSYWRSALAALSILVGALALTTALGSRSILNREIPSSYAATEPAAAILRLDRVDDSVLEVARSTPGVQRADARRLVRARAEIAPGEWRPLLLFGVRDFRDQQVATFRPVSGDWPPRVGEVLVEQSALTVLRARSGDHLTIRVPGGHKVRARIGGIVFDGGQAPGWQDNAGYAYVSGETLAAFGLGEALDELLITVAGDEAEAARVARALAARLSADGHTINLIEVPSREHPHADHMNSMMMLITSFGALALMLAGALTATVITGILGRQVRQIGIMKAMGGTSGRIGRMYAAYVLVLALPAVIAGIAVGLVLADQYASFSAVQLNIELVDRTVSYAAILGCTLICLGVPFLAAAGPVVKAVRARAREAIQSVGIVPPRHQFGAIGVGDRTWVLALRNTFRRPIRLSLTLLALALAGAAMMTAANTNMSLIAAVDESLGDRGDDVDVRLLRPVPAHELLDRVHELPEVRDAEAWGGMLVSIALADSPGATIGTERHGLLAMPSASRMLEARMVTGRMPAAVGEVAVNRPLLAHEPQLAVGSEVILLAGSRRLPVKVVGLVEEIAEPHLYAHMATFDALTGTIGQAGALRVATTRGTEAKVAAAIEEIVADLGSLPVLSLSRPALRETAVNHFLLLLMLLSAAAIAAILVGGFSVGAAAGLNVLERRREIGVMRALGARPRTILRILLAEGMAVALLSVATAYALSLALTWAVNSYVGENGLNASLPFVVSLPALGSWVAIAVIVTLLASLGPAVGVLRRPAREALATE